MSKGHRSQLKEIPMARAGTFRTKDNLVLLDYNPKCKVNIPIARPARGRTRLGQSIKGTDMPGPGHQGDGHTWARPAGGWTRLGLAIKVTDIPGPGNQGDRHAWAWLSRGTDTPGPGGRHVPLK